MGELPVFFIDCVNRKLVGGKVYEITHLGNKNLGWMLTTDSVKTRIAEQHAMFRLHDPATGLEEDINLFNDPTHGPIPRSHNGRRFTDALHGLGDCRDLKLID